MSEKSKKKKEYKTQKVGKLEPYEYILTFKTNKEKDKIIKRIERQIRASIEYRDYIKFLKDYVNMNACAFFKNISNDGAENKKIKIEVHHEPFTLRDYVEVVLNKYIDLGMPLNELYISDEVMQIHYENRVGLIPLSKTMHQVIHKSNKIKIPLYMVYGDYMGFMRGYEEYLTDEMIEKLERKANETNAIKEDSFEPLEKQYTYLEIDGVELPKLINDEEENPLVA